jgi:hypothetical protein
VPTSLTTLAWRYRMLGVFTFCGVLSLLISDPSRHGAVSVALVMIWVIGFSASADAWFCLRPQERESRARAIAAVAPRALRLTLWCLGLVWVIAGLRSSADVLTGSGVAMLLIAGMWTAATTRSAQDQQR